MPFIEIHFKGEIDSNWLDWFQGRTIQAISPNEVCLSSEVADNSAIYGILSTMSSLGITLISVSVSDQDETRTVHSSSNPG